MMRRVNVTASPASIVVLLAFAVLSTSCSTGVSQEEFDAARQDLEAERGKVVSLQSMVDEVEVEKALLESQLAQERARASDIEKKVEAAEAREALLAAFLAWNRKDAEAFEASFTDQGILETVMSLPESIGGPPISLRRVVDTEVSGDTAKVHAMFALGTQRNSVRYRLVRTDGGWKIDGEERLSPKIKGGTTKVDIRLDECLPDSGSMTLTSRNVALTVDNVGGQPYHLTLVRVPEGVNTLEALRSLISEGGVEVAAYVHSLQGGEQHTVAFASPLAPGRYLMLCNDYRRDGNKSPADMVQGVVADLTVP